MVLPLKPGKFYGRSLPRPRIFTDVKLNEERVDPPVPVLDPLMSWAKEAHWSMGGLSFNRLRLQGKIEGNVKKLKKERETSFKNKIQNSPPVSEPKKKGGNRGDSPPPAPISKKRKQRSKMVEEEEEFEEGDWDDEEEEEIEFESKKEGKNNGGLKNKKRRRLVRKLGDDFDLVSSDNGRSPLKDMSNGGGFDGVALRTRSRRSMVLMEVEEQEDNYGNKAEGKKGDIENGKVEKMKGSKNNEGKSSRLNSGSANGSRSSPRLKQRLG